MKALSTLFVGHQGGKGGGEEEEGEKMQGEEMKEAVCG